MKWQVWYSDGTIVSSDDISPFHITHRDDVQVIIQADRDNGWRTITTDYFVWDDRGNGAKWWGCTDVHAVMHYLRQPGQRCVLFGTWIEDEDHDRIFNEARKEWGEKLGYARGEKKI